MKLNPNKKFIIMISILVLCLLILHFSPLSRYLKDVQRFRLYIENTGVWAPLVFFAMTMVFVAFGVPRLAFCAVGGLVFGFLEGFALAHVGSLAGSYCTFLFARWGGGEWLARRLESRPRVAKLLANPTATTVFIARQLPVAGVAMNSLLGMAAVSHWSFLTGSFFGFFPAGIASTLIGSGIGRDSVYISVLQIGSAVVMLVFMAVVILRIRKQFYENGS